MTGEAAMPETAEVAVEGRGQVGVGRADLRSPWDVDRAWPSARPGQARAPGDEHEGLRSSPSSRHAVRRHVGRPDVSAWSHRTRSLQPHPAMSRRADSAEHVVRELFGLAGVRIGGPGPGDITVHDPRFYGRLLRDASIGMGESYMDGWWDTDALDVLIEKILRAGLQDRVTGSVRLRLLTARAIVLNLRACDTRKSLSARRACDVKLRARRRRAAQPDRRFCGDGRLELVRRRQQPASETISQRPPGGRGMSEIPTHIHGYTKNKAALIKRLHRIEGQVRGVERMVEEDRYCIDILTQIAAANTALESLAFQILDDHVTHCVASALASGNGADAAEKSRELIEAVRRFSRTR